MNMQSLIRLGRSEWAVQAKGGFVKEQHQGMTREGLDPAEILAASLHPQ
jgi:hypothetical protein